MPRARQDIRLYYIYTHSVSTTIFQIVLHYYSTIEMRARQWKLISFSLIFQDSEEKQCGSAFSYYYYSTRGVNLWWWVQIRGPYLHFSLGNQIMTGMLDCRYLFLNSAPPASQLRSSCCLALSQRNKHDEL